MKNTAHKLDNEINSFNKIIKKQTDYLGNTKTFWKSENGNIIRDKYNDALKKSKLITSKYVSVESNLYQLSSKIQKADSARKQAAQKAKN